MPPELMELYNLYKMEIETRETNENDQNLLVEAEKILRVSGFFKLDIIQGGPSPRIVGLGWVDFDV